MDDCNKHGWNSGDNEPCPYCCIDSLRAEVETQGKEIWKLRGNCLIANEDKRLAEAQNRVLREKLIAVKKEVETQDPYKTDRKGICLSCGVWAPKDHNEAHEHKEGCEMVRLHHEWDCLEDRILPLLS